MKVMYGTQSGFITRDSVSLVMDASEFRDTLITTPEALRDAIEQSVRGWVLTTPEFNHASTNTRAEVIKDLTQHLFGNVVMALRFGKWVGGNVRL